MLSGASADSHGFHVGIIKGRKLRNYQYGVFSSSMMLQSSVKSVN